MLPGLFRSPEKPFSLPKPNRCCPTITTTDGKQTLNNVMDKQRVKAIHRVEVQNNKGQPSVAHLEMKYHRLQIQPPLGKEKRYKGLTVTVIRARERGNPKDREPIDWKLITNLPATSKAQAIEKLDWYAMHWKIEPFHKVLKSGCRAEESKLRTAERLANLIAMMSIFAWRVLWLCMVNRVSPDLPARLVFTNTEIAILNSLVPAKVGARKRTVGNLLNQLARLGGYLNRTRDSLPGNLVLWRGIARLTDIHLGFMIARDVGN